MPSIWNHIEIDTEKAKKLSKELKITLATAKILVNRGISTKEKGETFLYPRLKHLPDPFLLHDMEKAVERILKAVKSGEKIAIFGDYDADGITSCALLVRFFREYGIETKYFLPNRFTDGYGLSKSAVDRIKESGATLLITTDNGTSAADEISYANEVGVDVVVTDHHEAPDKLPNAIAIVNPKLPLTPALSPKGEGETPPPPLSGEGRGKGKNTPSPLGERGVEHPEHGRGVRGSEFTELAGVGVAFYLAAALRSKFRSEKIFSGIEVDLKKFLYLVAIGTVADVAPLTGINRILVKNGIEILKYSENLGIKALSDAASTNLKEIDTYSIAFRLAPRINAAGRLGNETTGLDLLLTESPDEARVIAGLLNKMNSERQRIEIKILEKTDELIEKTCKERSSIVLWSDEWHQGVIGIVASRIAEKYKKPCAIISFEGEVGRGSVRSVGEFNVMDALSASTSSLIDFGGHKAAAGFDIEKNKMEEFYNLFDSYISQNLSDEEAVRKIKIDCEISADDIDRRLIDELDLVAPFGEGNRQPTFSIKASSVENVKIVRAKHLKLTIRDNMTTLNAIGFNMGDRKIESNKEYQFAGTPQINEWNGFSTIQLKIKDICDIS